MSEIMPTLHVNCLIKVDDNKTRMKRHKILVSDIMTLSKRLKSDQGWRSWSEWQTNIKCTQSKQKWFTQSQKKIYINRVNNTIWGAFCWNWTNHSGKLCHANGIKAMNHDSKPWFSQRQKKEHLNRMREIQFRETSADTEQIKYNTNGIKTRS